MIYNKVKTGEMSDRTSLTNLGKLLSAGEEEVGVSRRLVLKTFINSEGLKSTDLNCDLILLILLAKKFRIFLQSRCGMESRLSGIKESADGVKQER